MDKKKLSAIQRDLQRARNFAGTGAASTETARAGHRKTLHGG